MLTVGISFKTAQCDIDKLDVIAEQIYRQPRAGALRLILMEAIEKHYSQALVLRQENLSYTETCATEQPVKEIPVVKCVTPDYDATAKWGAPKACPICDAVNSSDGLDRPALNVMRSATNWGVWACHECFSAGRWYDDQPFIILENTRAEDDLPFIQDKK